MVGRVLPLGWDLEALLADPAGHSLAVQRQIAKWRRGMQRYFFCEGREALPPPALYSVYFPFGLAGSATRAG